MSLVFSREFSNNSSNMKHHKTPSTGSRVFPYGHTDRQTDTTKLIVPFHDFDKASRNNKFLCLMQANNLSQLTRGKVIPLRARCGPEGGRRIALLFHDRGTRRRWVVSSTPRPHFTNCTGGWVGPRAGLDGWKISPPPGFDTGPSSPVAQSLYRLSYRTHMLSRL